jgi:hypothetical protein
MQAKQRGNNMATTKNTHPNIIMSAEEANAIALRMMKERLEGRTNLKTKKGGK